MGDFYVLLQVQKMENNLSYNPDITADTEAITISF